MRKLQSVSESLKLAINEAHVDTDKMMYADGIAKALQLEKTELGNPYLAEIVNSSSDYASGGGGGSIKFTVPAVPDKLEYSVEVLNRKGPTLGNDGVMTDVPETADVTIKVSINGNPAVEETLKDQAIESLTQSVIGVALKAVREYHQKQVEVVTEAKGKKGKINESPEVDIATVAAGIASVIASGVGIAGLMEYLKKKYPKTYKELSKLGSAASDSRSRGVNLPENKKSKVNESPEVDLATVAAGIAGVVGSGVGIAALMEYLKKNYPKIHKELSKLGSAASDSRSRGVNTPEN